MLAKANQYITDILKQSNDFNNIVTLERIANIIAVRLRRYIKDMSDKEIYEFTKNISALRKMKAVYRHKLTDTIIKFL